MPSYILHLTAAQMLLELLPDSSPLRRDPACRNAFLSGNLMPDATTNKAASHFRNPAYQTKIMEYPDLTRFRQEYGSFLEHPFCLGYYYHLYIDRKFFKDYIPLVAQFLTADGQETDERALVAVTHLIRQDTDIPFDQYLSELYYYGDYTKMSGYLARRYRITDWMKDLSACCPCPEAASCPDSPCPDQMQQAQVPPDPLCPNWMKQAMAPPDPLCPDWMQQAPLQQNPSHLPEKLTALCCGDLPTLLQELEQYVSVPDEAVQDLTVFDLDDLTSFLEQKAREFSTALHSK